jgi:hypothetical protein
MRGRVGLGRLPCRAPSRMLRLLLAELVRSLSWSSLSHASAFNLCWLPTSAETPRKPSDHKKSMRLLAYETSFIGSAAFETFGEIDTKVYDRSL